MQYPEPRLQSRFSQNNTLCTALRTRLDDRRRQQHENTDRTSPAPERPTAYISMFHAPVLAELVFEPNLEFDPFRTPPDSSLPPAHPRSTSAPSCRQTKDADKGDDASVQTESYAHLFPLLRSAVFRRVLLPSGSRTARSLFVFGPRIIMPSMTAWPPIEVGHASFKNIRCLNPSVTLCSFSILIPSIPF